MSDPSMGRVVARAFGVAPRLLRALRTRPRRSRQLRSPRRRQELRTWARLTGGRLGVLGGVTWPASLGPATVTDSKAFSAWQATRKRGGTVPDAVPLREQPIEVGVDPRPTPEREDA